MVSRDRLLEAALSIRGYRVRRVDNDFPGQSAAICREQVLDRIEVDCEDDHIRFADCVSDRHGSGFAAQFGGKLLCLRQGSVGDDEVFSAGGQIFANWEPMFPRPMIAVFMIIRFLVYGSLKSVRVAELGCPIEPLLSSPL